MKKHSYIIPYHMQFFAEDTGGEAGGTGNVANSDMQELNNLLDNLGNEGATSTGSDGTNGTNTGTDGAAGGQTDPKPEQNQTAQQKPDKAGYAFGELRTQNNQLLGLLAKVAQATGIDFKDNNELLAKLNDDAINKLAKAQNVPPELLKRMEHLELNSKLYEVEQLKNTAVAGFNKLKDEYGLTNAELQTFAKELDDAKKNPFLTPVDLEAEYKVLHMNDIINKRVAAAVEEALKKSSAADKHSSTPNSAQGKPDSGNAEKITTLAGLNDILKNV